MRAHYVIEMGMSNEHKVLLNSSARALPDIERALKLRHDKTCLVPSNRNPLD